MALQRYRNPSYVTKYGASDHADHRNTRGGERGGGDLISIVACLSDGRAAGLRFPLVRRSAIVTDVGH